MLDWLRAADRDLDLDDLRLHRLAGARRGRDPRRQAGDDSLGHLERLGEPGAEPVGERVVEDGKLVTAAGVSAGIDMALSLAARIAGDQVAEAIQLGIEYDPQPPFDSGSPAKASADVVELIRAGIAARA